MRIEKGFKLVKPIGGVVRGGIHSPARLMECPSLDSLAELVGEQTTPRPTQTVGIFFARLNNVL
jgi:hypothetical protein